MTLNFLQLKRYILITLLMVSATVAYGREIRGMVTDDKSQPLPGATCTVLALPDSTILSARITDSEGRFVMLTPDSCAWMLRITYIGCEPLAVGGEEYRQDSPCTIFRLSTASSQLGEVVVEGRRPQVTMRDEGFVYNPAEILRKYTVTSAHDLVSKIPVVDCSDGNSLSLSGAAMGSEVYLNGRKSQMSQSQLMEYLKTVPASQVKDVEIVYTPSPKWKTNTAVINVTLKRMASGTYNGQLTASGTDRHAFSYNAGASLFAGMGKWELAATYNYIDSRGRVKETQRAMHTAAGETRMILDTCDTRSHGSGHNVYASMTFRPTNSSSVELSYNGGFSPRLKNLSRSSNTIVGLSDGTSNGHNAMNALSLVYASPIGLTAGAEFVDYSLHDAYTLRQPGRTDEQLMLSSTSHQGIRKFRAYADGSSPLGKKWRLSYGGSIQQIHNTNSQQAESELPVTSATSTTDETSATLYAGIYRPFLADKLRISASLTGEIYKIGGYRKNTLMPNVTATWYASSAHILQAYFRSFRNYPSFWQMQDFVSYANEYRRTEGNPSLRPALYNVAGAVYWFRSKYSLSAMFYDVKDFFFSQTYLSPKEFVQISKTFNLQHATTLDITLTAPFDVGGRWFSTMKAIVNQERFWTDDWHGHAFDIGKWVFRLRSDNSVLLCQKPRVSVDFSGFISTPSLVGLWERPFMWSVNVGLTASLLSDRLSVAFRVNDIFGSLSAKEKMNFAGQSLSIIHNHYSRILSLSASYKFRGYKERAARTVDTSRFGTN